LSGHPAINWSTATGAATYEVLLDATDPKCGSPYQTYKNLTTTAATVATQSGQSYLCVIASNALGSTAASNSGMELQCDAAVPPTPSAPTGVPGAVDINFTWSAVTNAGQALTLYHLHIGTTPGGEDVYNAPVDGLSYDMIGFAGKTYYAAVAADDSLGNESAFSAPSAGLMILDQ
jgi:hypothetical protein